MSQYDFAVNIIMAIDNSFIDLVNKLFIAKTSIAKTLKVH